MGESLYKSEFMAYVLEPLATIGFANIHNGCCKDRPVLITANKAQNWPGGINYSCQCACGMWCTNGHGTAGEALSEYEQMTERAKEERNNAGN